jgi:hypothetical protein
MATQEDAVLQAILARKRALDDAAIAAAPTPDPFALG